MPSTWTVVESRCSCDARIANRGGIDGAGINTPQSDFGVDAVQSFGATESMLMEVPMLIYGPNPGWLCSAIWNDGQFRWSRSLVVRISPTTERVCQVQLEV